MKRFFLLAGLAAAFVLACSSTTTTPVAPEDDEHSSFPSCAAITAACHPLDTGAGAIHECHEVAHDATTEAACAAKKDECLATCKKPDAGTDAASGSADAASDVETHDHDH